MQKVSIVTISFNQAGYLEQAIESVLRQDHPSIEYIVVDPGSKDGSRDIIERYRHRISKVIYDPDRGPADGLNHGFAAATGDVFAYLNADDLLLPGAVSSALLAFNAPELAVVFGDGYIIDAQGRVLRRCFSNNFSASRYALGSAIIMQQSSFWRREWHHRIGGFNPDNRTYWDGEFFFKVALAGGKFQHAKRYWSCFRIHEQSISGSGRVNEEYIAHQGQLLAQHHHRYGRFLPVLRGASRLRKYIEDPRIVVYGLAERIFGVPRVQLPVAH